MTHPTYEEMARFSDEDLQALNMDTLIPEPVRRCAALLMQVNGARKSIQRDMERIARLVREEWPK